MSAIEILAFLYLSGVFGSLIAVALFGFPKNTHQLRYLIDQALFWPLTAWYAYNREINRRALIISEKKYPNLINDLEAYKIQSLQLAEAFHQKRKELIILQNKHDLLKKKI